MSDTIILPCGKTAIVTELTGAAQRHISDVLQSAQSGQSPAVDSEDKVLAEVVSELGSRAPRPRDLLDLRSGSRRRLMIAARRATYGDEVEMEWQCGGKKGCGAKNTRTISLASLIDLPFVREDARFKASNGVVFTLGWGTGRTEQDFARASLRREVSIFDEPLTRVLKINDEARGMREVMKLSGKILDEVRAAGRAMVPVFDIDAGEIERPELPEDAPAPDVVSDPRLMPRAGCAERLRLTCEHCGHRNAVTIAGQPDFLLRGVSNALED